MTQGIMVKTTKIILSGAVLAALVSSCGIYETKPNALNRNNMIGRVDSQAQISFNDVQGAIFKVRNRGGQTCQGCHTDGGSEGGVVLDTYADVKREISRIQGTVFDGVPTRMPKRAQLGDDQKQLLKQWIDQGVLEAPVIPGPTVEPTPTATPEATPTATPVPTPVDGPTPTATPVAPSVLLPTYQSIRENVFTAKCLTCHAPGGRADDLPFDTYAAMMGVGQDLLVPGSPDDSPIYKESKSGSMPPRNAHLPKVTADELAVIKQWITNGAPEQ